LILRPTSLLAPTDLRTQLDNGIIHTRRRTPLLRALGSCFRPEFATAAAAAGASCVGGGVVGKNKRAGSGGGAGVPASNVVPRRPTGRTAAVPLTRDPTQQSTCACSVLGGPIGPNHRPPPCLDLAATRAKITLAFCMCMGRDSSSPETEIQGHRSRSRPTLDSRELQSH